MSIPHLLALHSLAGMNNERLRKIMDYYTDPVVAWEDSRNWAGVPGLGKEAALHLDLAKRELDFDDTYERFLQLEGNLVSIYDEDYPELLRHIYEAPVILYYKGTLPREDQLSVAMVGTRHSTAYGRMVAEDLAKDLARHGVWVISGMARGIDACCHQGALDGNGKTIAVLGSGLDVIYPKENTDLYYNIVENGCVISEFPLGTTPLPRNFPVRNRIISGLAQGVVVVEAAEKSGTLITVDYGMEQGKTIFAVPGPITSKQSKTPHRLIREGAKLVSCAEDVIEEFSYLFPEVKATPVINGKENAGLALSETEEKILEMTTVAMHFENILVETGLEAKALSSLLFFLEMKGYIKQLPGQYYIAEIKN